jgi:hypothetical protein
VQRKRNESAAILAIATPDAQPLAQRIETPDQMPPTLRDRPRWMAVNSIEMIGGNAAKITEFRVIRSRPLN